jgi:CheY-like chemotaxis protein
LLSITEAGAEMAQSRPESEPILVVDDNPDQLETMTEVLELDGYAVLRACNGKEALKLAASHSVCLILLDLAMPVMDGWEFLQERKRTPRLSLIPVVVISAYASPKPCDADVVMQKPVNLDELREIVRRHCAASADLGDVGAAR